MSIWKSPPEEAWRDYIQNATSKPGWIEDSKKISDEIGLSKRELFALILLAHLYSHENGNWHVGYDKDEPEPNDGFFSDGNSKISVEHKVIAQTETKEALNAILSRYEANAKKGKGYGQNRVLVIQPNQATKGMIKISDLRDAIKDDCPFEKVFLIHCVKTKENGRTAIMHVTQHFPENNGIAEVEFDFLTGKAAVPHCGIKID